jgi:hypothetical protein
MVAARPDASCTMIDVTRGGDPKLAHGITAERRASVGAESNKTLPTSSLLL